MPDHCLYHATTNGDSDLVCGRVDGHDGDHYDDIDGIWWNDERPAPDDLVKEEWVEEDPIPDNVVEFSRG